MYKVGDLVMYLPRSQGLGSWIMYSGIGIIVSLVQYNKRGKLLYRVKWIKDYSESMVSEDFLVKVEEPWPDIICKNT